MQALAYKTAIELITNVKPVKYADIKLRGGEVYRLESDTWNFTFFKKRVSFSPTKLEKSSWSPEGYICPLWNCIIEEKLQ